MAFHPRKLLNESEVYGTTTGFCDQFCDPSPAGICPPPCFNLCNSTCIALNSLIPPPPPPPPDFSGGYSSSAPAHASKLFLLLIISLAIIVTCFFLFSCYTIYKFFNLNWRNLSRRRWEPRRAEDEESGRDDFLDAEHGPVVDHYLWYVRTVGIEPSVISKIAIVKYKKGDGLVEGTDCAVCLNEFQEDETLRLLPKCSHAFHIPCIDTWLNSHTNCPVCRAGIVNNAVIASEGLAVQNSGLGEETSPAAGVGRESEDQPSELRIRIRDDNESPEVIGLKLDDVSGGSHEIQPVRRSVSMDSLSASVIRDAVSMAFPAQSNRDSDQESSVEMKDSTVGIVAKRDEPNEMLMKFVEKSTVRTLQTGSSSITRSLSCSARLFLSRYTRGNRDSIIRQ